MEAASSVTASDFRAQSSASAGKRRVIRARLVEIRTGAGRHWDWDWGQALDSCIHLHTLAAVLIAGE